MKLLIPLIVVCLINVGCMTGSPPGSDSWTIEIPLATSKNVKVPTTKKLKKKGKRRTARFCLGDGPLTKRIGLVDTLTRKLLKKKGKYVVNVKIAATGDDCVKAEGYVIR